MSFLVNSKIFGVPLVVTTTWDPANKSSDITLSGGNLTASNGATSGGLRGTQATTTKSSGKYHFEITLGSGSGLGHRIVVGETPPSFNDIASGDYDYVTYNNNGQVRQQIQGGFNTLLETIETFSTTNLIGIDVDVDSKQVYFQKNGSIRRGPYSLSHVTNPVCAIIGMTVSTTINMTANFGNTSFTLTPLSGHGAWT